MASRTPFLTIANLKGGMNDQDPPHALPEDQCVLAKNVDFFQATLGERRKGCAAASLQGSDFLSEAGVVFLGSHVPLGAEVGEAHKFAVAATEGVSTKIAYKAPSVNWTPITPKDPLIDTFPEVLKINGQSIHGKYFLAYKSGVDRMHVWDGTNLRRTGLDAPSGSLSVTNSAPAGSYTGDRIFRIRLVEIVGGKVVRRSEPTPEATFTPSGSKDGAVVSIASLTLPDEGETDWELEASDGDGNFYRIATTPIATTSYTDTTQPATDYAVNGTLSSDIGDYDLLPSYKFVKADQDRLIFAYQWEDPQKRSRLAWTPVWADPGLMNDERIPTDIDSFLDLDWMDGGDITGMSQPVNGSFYVFKLSKIYKVQRTGNATQAYDAFLMMTGRGALEGSIVNGVDEYGKGCVYFLDPSAGPCRVGSAGIQYLQNIRGTWKSVNTHANKVVCHGLFYPDRQQLWWWVATGSSDSPTLRLVLQLSEVRSTQEGTERGWSLYDGPSAMAYCSEVLPQEEIDPNTGQVSLFYRPFAGFYGDSFYLQQLDIGNDDNGFPYYAELLTRPYMIAGLTNWWGGMAGALLASPIEDATVTMNVGLVRDFGKETNAIETDFVPEGDESLVIKRFDNLKMSYATAIQVRFWESA